MKLLKSTTIRITLLGILLGFIVPRIFNYF